MKLLNKVKTNLTADDSTDWIEQLGHDLSYDIYGRHGEDLIIESADDISGTNPVLEYTVEEPTYLWDASSIAVGRFIRVTQSNSNSETNTIVNTIFESSRKGADRDLKPAEMNSNTIQNITSIATLLTFSDPDFTDDEYTLDAGAAAGSITFDNADGIKKYEVDYKVCIDGIDLSASVRANVIVRALMDGIEIPKAKTCVYFREANDGNTNTSTSVSFYVKPSAGQVLTLTIEKTDTATCQADSRLLKVKRVK